MCALFLLKKKKKSFHLQTPLSPTQRSRRKKRRAAAKPRLQQRRAVWRYGPGFIPPVWTGHPLLRPQDLSSHRVSLCPGAQAHWSTLHPHLCSALQVSASGTEWPGTTVSKNWTGCLLASTCVYVLDCLCGIVHFLSCVSSFALSVHFAPLVVPAGWNCPHHLQRTMLGGP